MVKINSFIGGLSDTDSRMAAGQFPYAENLEIMKQPEFVKLAFKPVSEVNTTSVAKRMYCSVFAQTGSLSNIFFMGEDGRVIDVDNGNTVLSSGFDITACVQYKIGGTNYILWAYDGGSDAYLGRISVGQAYNSTDWTSEGTYDATYKTLSEEADTYHMLVWNNALYIAGDGTIERLSPSGNLEKVLEIQGRIVGMTDNGSHIRIYTELGKMYIWDGGSNTPQSTIDTGISEIRAAYGTGQQDWVVGGGSSSSSMFYMSNGYSYPVIKRGTDLSDEYDIERAKFDIFQGNANKQCIVDHQGMYWVTEDDHLSQFGKRYSSSPFSWNKYCSVASNGESINVITALLRLGNTLYYFYETSTGEGIDSISIDGSLESGSNRVYQSSGFVYSPKFMMGNVARIAYELFVRGDVDADTTITVKASINGSDTWNTIATINDTTDKRHIINMGDQIEFNEIQFKFELSTTDTDKSPKLYEYEFIPGPLRREGQS